MIEIPRRQLRQFRSVLRAFVGRGRSVAWPVIICKAGRHGLTLEARHDELAVRYHAPRPFPEDSLAFNSAVLVELEVNNSELVTLEQTEAGRGVARWIEKGECRTVEFETFAIEQTPAFPALPEEFTPMPANFLRVSRGRLAASDPARKLIGSPSRLLPPHRSIRRPSLFRGTEPCPRYIPWSAMRAAHSLIHSLGSGARSTRCDPRSATPSVALPVR
jgi:hypothetical protein